MASTQGSRILDGNGLATLWNLIKQKFQQRELKTGATEENPQWKELTDNNYTNDDKSKLAGIVEGANKVEASETNGNIKIDGTETTVYSMPTATSDTIGGIKVGSGLTITNGVLSTSVQTAEGENLATETWVEDYIEGELAEASGDIPQGSISSKIDEKIANKQDALTPGENITIIDNTIATNVIDDTAANTSNKKTWSASKINNEIVTAVANAGHLKREIVSNLPEVADADTNTVYMVLANADSSDNKYIEWMVINGVFEKTGDTMVDLSNYATLEMVDKLTTTDINEICV